MPSLYYVKEEKVEVKNISDKPYFSSLGTIWAKHTTVGTTEFSDVGNLIKTALITDHPTTFVNYPEADQEADEAEATLRAACAELRRLTPLADAARLEIARLSIIVEDCEAADGAYDEALEAFESKEDLRTLPRDAEYVDLCANQLPIFEAPNAATYPNLAFNASTKTYSTAGVKNVAIVGKVTATDPEGKDITYDVTTEPEHGSVVLNETTGVFTFTPTADYTGADEFKVTAEDVKGGKTVATVAITLTAS